MPRRSGTIESNLFLYTAKSGASVYVPLPKNLLQAFASLQNIHDDYFFWSARGDPKSPVADWQSSSKRLFTFTGIQGHAHRFRNAFAISLLQEGASLENVSIPLGHSNTLITSLHYAP